MAEHPDPSMLLSEALHDLLMSTEDVLGFLRESAILASREVVPGTDIWCGITMQPAHGPLTVASSDERANAVDEVQYKVDDGPCLRALRTGRIVAIDDLANDLEWDLFRSRGLRSGVGSSLSLPVHAGRTRAAMNLYAEHAYAFTPQARQRAELIATAIGQALGLAIRISDQVTLSAHLQTAMVSRATIDQAIGVLMSQSHCSPQAAFDILSRASMNRNIKLRDVAGEIIGRISGGAADPGPRAAPTGAEG